MSYPVNSFFLFCRDNRSNLLNQIPDQSNAQITALLGRMWRMLPLDEKESYRVAARLNKKNFKLSNPNFSNKEKIEKRYITKFKLEATVPPHGQSQKMHSTIFPQAAQRNQQERVKRVLLPSFLELCQSIETNRDDYQSITL